LRSTVAHCCEAGAVTVQYRAESLTDSWCWVAFADVDRSICWCCIARILGAAAPRCGWMDVDV